MKKIVTCAFIASLFLAACGSSSNDKTTSCVADHKDEGKMITTNTIKYSKDKVSTYEIKNVIDLESNTVFTEEMLKEYAKSIKQHYDELAGVKYSFKSTEKEFIEEIVLELNDETIEGIRTSGAIGKYVGTENDSLSAKKMIKMMEEDGQTCK